MCVLECDRNSVDQSTCLRNRESEVQVLPVAPIYGTIAQLVEQRTFNPLVGRSNRPGPTIIKGNVAEPGLMHLT